ncbi:hypothetical protein SISSUDRAFT_160575 [Sistotremastrum suecicum HHB10207 ss-3]|uniref:Tyrosine specific protein phosphatases domain-containing protein n=1 Tax=Sistotremastrum suecicum HHB10207 ss-3 TaxID=1314776 RepID=A0A166APU5_9AGAM|nr:hypothetical protein SISSUDRAFT_160575 [Sistotremastrum suecicum HHB10207 ss-3]
MSASNSKTSPALPPPFVVVDGVSNIRDLGGYPLPHGNVSKKHVAFRSAEVSSITEKGKEQLRRLGVSVVYDLRSDLELAKFNAPLPDIPGVEVTRVPVFKSEDYSPDSLAKRYALYASGKIESFMQLYTQILDNAGPAYSTILRRIRDKPNEAVLFHCTAGKDRTGVLAAIILSLAGASDQDIATDYELTQIGRAAVREQIMARIANEPAVMNNREGALNMLSSKYEVMIALLKLLKETRGGAEGYCRSIGLTDEDIQIIRTNMTTKARL